MKKNAETKNAATTERVIRKGAETYVGAWVGVKNDHYYLGLKKEDGTSDFISSYEMLAFLNSILEDADKIYVTYSEETSKKGVKYEACTPTGIHWSEE